jgi:hypothetical protein
MDGFVAGKAISLLGQISPKFFEGFGELFL